MWVFFSGCDLKSQPLVFHKPLLPIAELLTPLGLRDCLIWHSKWLSWVSVLGRETDRSSSCAGHGALSNTILNHRDHQTPVESQRWFRLLSVGTSYKPATLNWIGHGKMKLKSVFPCPFQSLLAASILRCICCIKWSLFFFSFIYFFTNSSRLPQTTYS